MITPVLAYFAAYNLILLAASAVGDVVPGIARQLMAGAGAHAVGGAVCMWVAATHGAGGWRRFLFGPGRATSRENMARTAGVLIVAWGACPAVLWLTVRIMAPLAPGLGEEVHPTIQWLRSGDIPWTDTALLWLAAVVVAPVAEELFFRGVLQNALHPVLGNSWSAIGLASAAFALVHAEQPATLPAIFLLSVLLGYLYQRNDNIMAPTMVHALFNARTMLWETMA